MRLFTAAVWFPPTRWLLSALYVDDNPKYQVRQMGLDFPNHIGLAAGFDKDGRWIHELAYLGFGFVEVGTVTPIPQEGNPKPRLFRLKKDRALINRMGFNNGGLDALVERLKAVRAKGLPRPMIIGANIGKNKITPNADATSDYLKCFEALFPYADYFVVNVSSPNTPGLRELQEKKPLTALLMALQAKNAAKTVQKPILLKIAPDLTEGQIEDIAAILKVTKLAGLIATNTTIQRSGLETTQSDLDAIGNGGLSGAPVGKQSDAVLQRFRELLGKDVLLIGVGGIEGAATGQRKLDVGANLLQVYSGLIYSGPSLIKNLLRTKEKV